jgi:hypothetical protein
LRRLLRLAFGARFLAPILFGFAAGVIYAEGKITLAAMAAALGFVVCVVTSQIAMRIAMPELQRFAEKQQAPETAPPN